MRFYLEQTRGQEAADKCFRDIDHIIYISLKSVQNLINNDRHCFEMYGYDIMIDNNLKPWLIEVNASPSMSSDTQTDHDLKFGLLDDMLTCVDMEQNFNGRTPKRVGGFDLICDNGVNVRSEEFASLPTMLGTNNDRLRNLKKLQKWCQQGAPA